ncbi:MAG: caspase family protein [Candidatus Accumulibacter sp.]|uniref:caspase family protein n=1 Tax=Accumulibacter sp. TaxID=2053492 RepID=UPI001ACE86A4|nr:caspase family protein [Accumulibacter sp.]MBN8518371.1 caspase family protein [Accumulibacter sp.]MBO3712513.1 caspase family protein [Accumulibacter sp.]
MIFRVWYLLGLLCLVLPTATNVLAADRVLAMTISDYERQPLPGARRDRDNVRRIVQLLGLDSEHYRAVADRELTAEGIERELARLVRETENGDRVYVFFSGHGTSRLVNGRCEQSLLAQDMRPIDSTTIADYLGRIKDKAGKVVMMVDACHSGGVTETVSNRGGDGRQRRLRAKFVEPESTAERCSKPVNVVEEKIRQGIRSARGFSLDNNYVYLAAARRDEVAFDDENKGGLATSSLLDCLSGSLADADRSGSVSFRELALCAQGRIDAELRNDPVNRPHHLTLSGNQDMPILAAASAVPASGVSSATTNSAANSAANAVATLRDLASGADGRWQVNLAAKPQRARIHQEAFRLSVTSSQEGYLYLLYVGSDQKEFLQLYPDQRDRSNRVRAGEVFAVPGEFTAMGPAGTNHVLAIVADAPRDFSGLFGKTGSVPATLGNAAALQEAGCAMRNLKRVECQGENRNLQRRPQQEGESGTYGAAMLELVEE